MTTAQEEASAGSESADRRVRTLVELLGGGAAGVGAVLVLVPTLAIIGGVVWSCAPMILALPVLAILGIMILLGTLALVAMLFRQLGLANPREPMALPPGSMRAAIAMSLIVLFAIISITLFLSMSARGEPYRVSGLRDAERTALVTAAVTRVLAVSDDKCAVDPPVAASAGASAASASDKPAAASPAVCSAGDRRYVVELRSGPSAEANDLAKQLLILIGTLMTSVTSYYFAARSGADAARDAKPQAEKPASDPKRQADKPATDPKPQADKPATDPRQAPAQGGAATVQHPQ